MMEKVTSALSEQDFRKAEDHAEGYMGSLVEHGLLDLIHDMLQRIDREDDPELKMTQAEGYPIAFAWAVSELSDTVLDDWEMEPEERARQKRLGRA